VLVVLVVIGVSIFAFRGQSGNATPSPAPEGSLQSVQPDISPSLPADAPKGDTISLQGKNGVVKVNNFYKTAKGYWTEVDALVLEKSDVYTIWYYRFNSMFEIALSPSGTTPDERAAETKLMQDLGIKEAAFCGLTVIATYPLDKGNEKESLPLSFCPGAAGF